MNVFLVCEAWNVRRCAFIMATLPSSNPSAIVKFIRYLHSAHLLELRWNGQFDRQHFHLWSVYLNLRWPIFDDVQIFADCFHALRSKIFLYTSVFVEFMSKLPSFRPLLEKLHLPRKKCAVLHTFEKCKEKTSNYQRCINCISSNKNGAKFNVRHRASDDKCPSFKSILIIPSFYIFCS